MAVALHGCQIFLGTIYENVEKTTTIVRNGQKIQNIFKIFQTAEHKIYQNFHSKAFQKLPKLVFLV
jgi:hypothetical protein